MVLVKGFPSQEKQIEMGVSERKRVEAQVAALGEEGLKQKEKELQEAMIVNEVRNLITWNEGYEIFQLLFLITEADTGRDAHLRSHTQHGFYKLSSHKKLHV